MRKVDESRAANYIRKHSNYKKWLAFVLCLSLLTGTITLYTLNKPATAMTEDGAEEVGVILDTASSEDEAELIQETMENKLESQGDGDDDDDLFDFGDGDDNDDDDEDGDGEDADELKKSGDNAETEDLVEEEETEGEEEAEEEDELTENVVLTASYVDEDGEAIADDEEISDDLEFSEDAPSIEGYTFKKATYKSSEITKITVKKTEDDIRYFEVTFEDGEEKEIKKDASIVLTYTADEKKELVLTASYVDEDGKEIADEKELEITESFDPKKDADAIEGYTFKEAKIDEDVVTLITAIVDEESGDKYYEATLEDDSTVEIKEDTTIELTYAVVDTTVVLTANYVDKNGEEIQDSQDLNIGDETELKKSKITEVDGYFFYKAIYEEKEITKIAPIFEDDENADDEDTNEDADSEDEEESSSKAIGYEFTTADGDTIEITEDAEIELTFLKASTETEFTFSDGKVTVKATVNGKNVFPEGIELKVNEVTKNSTGYNYGAYMDALNDNAEAIAQEAGQDNAVEYTEYNTLFYDIAFMFEEKELQPAEGSVSISIEFKKNQLSNELDVLDDKGITVIHLPIKDEVKEADEFTSTLDATDITSADIEVKTLADATSEISDVEKVEFEESSFSVFVINGEQLNTWNGSQYINLANFKDISPLFNFSVVANKLTSLNHLEGNIRVASLELRGAITPLNQGQGKIKENPITEILVEKKVENGSDGTFSFVFYDEQQQKRIKEFTITTKDGYGKEDIRNTDIRYSGVFDALNALDLSEGEAAHYLHVYELDSKNQMVVAGEKNGDYTVTYSYSDIFGGEQTEIATDHYANYIGRFTPDKPTALGMNMFNTDRNYVGQKWEVKDGNFVFDDFTVQNATNENYKGWFEYVPGLEEAIKGDMVKASKTSIALADAKNYPTKGQAENKTGNVVNVINLKSTTGVLSTDLANANFQSPYIQGLVRDDQYLLINISVSGKKYELDYADFDSQGQNSFGPLSSHVIFNFVGPVGDSGIPTESYGGDIRVSKNSSGLLLAPEAYVDQLDGTWNGEIIADEVLHNGQEIHKKPLTSGKIVKVSITNTGSKVYDAKLTLHKYLNGTLSKTPFSFTVSVLDTDGTLKDLKSNVTNDENGTISYEAEDVGKYVRPVGANNEKTVFFLIKENEVSSEFTKDESYIIAKVTGLDNTEHKYQYFRVDSSETPGIDSDPELITTYTKNPLKDNAAFYNKSHSLIVKKEWKNQNGSEVGNALISTFSPVNIAVMRTYEGATGPEIYKTVTLSSNNGFTDTLTEVPRYTEDGKEYTYYIQETNSSNDPISAREGIEYYKIVKGVKSEKTTINCEEISITLGDDVEEIVLVCINTRDLNVLPSTGGVGDLPYMAAGAGTAVAGLLGTGLYYKKKKDDDQEEE